MYQCRRILAGMDISPTDPTVVQYAALLSTLTPAAQVTFIHAARDLDVAEAGYLRYPDLPEPLSVCLRKHMQETIQHHFQGAAQTHVRWEVLQGAPLSVFLQRVRAEDIDLIVVGKKRHSTLPGKLARKAPCPVLIVPTHAPARITRILVPVDFSEHAAVAMDIALTIARSYHVTHMFCQHVYHLPHGYHALGMTSEEAATQVQEQAAREYQAFVKRFDLQGVSLRPILTFDIRIAAAIRDTIAQTGADLLVMGTRGRSAAAALLLGSVTEKLIWTTTVPLLVAKAKGERKHLLDLLLHDA